MKKKRGHDKLMIINLSSGTFLLATILLTQLTTLEGEEWDPASSPDLFVTANTFELIGFVGNGVTMYATVRGNPRPTSADITWIKMQGNLPEDRIQITYDLATNESRLRISELEYADAGTYFCQANVNGVSKSVSMTLRVVVEPGVERVTGLISSKAVGQSVTFSVSVSGNPVPTAEDISWATTDDRGLPVIIAHDRVQYLDGNKEFTITDLRISDEGWYKCLVITDEGKAETDFVLHVLGMREIQENAVGVVGNSVTMTCTATYFNMIPESPTITWYRYEAPDVPLPGSSIITKDVAEHAVSSITLNDLDWSDEGAYFCTSSYTNYPDNSIYNASLAIRGISGLSGPDVEAVLGNEIVMTCVARGDIQATISWTHNGTTPVSGVSTYLAPYTTSTLTLAALALEKQGAYECEAMFDARTPRTSGSAQLNLNYVWKTSGAVNGVEDNPLTVTCSAVGHVVPESWTWRDPNSTDISNWSSSDEKESSLTLPDVRRFDEGTYTCVAAYGQLGLSTGDVELTAQYITKSPSDLNVVYGTDTTLTCKTNLPPTNVVWYKDNVELTAPSTTSPDQTTSLISLSPADFPHSGVYKCEGVFPGGSTTSEEATLYVRGFTLQPQETTTVNMTVATLTCVARGDVAPELSWYIADTLLQHSPTVSVSTKAVGYTTTSRLSISLLSATTHDYHCTASWDNGDVIVTSSSASILVLGIESPPVDTTGVVGNGVVLGCGPTEPSAVITWLHNGTDTTEGVSVEEGVSRLSLPDLVWSEAGIYQCLATYPTFGTSYAAQSVTVSVRGVTQSPEDVITEEGSEITLTCVTTGPPVPALTWYKDELTDLGEGTVINGYKSLLVMTSVDLATTGDYKCVADYGNQHGNHQSSIARVIVRGIATHPDDTIAVKTNSARFTCLVRGEKAPSAVTWSRDDELVATTTASVATTTAGDDTTSVLTVDGVESAGGYKCTASFDSPAGEVVSGTADLRVLEFTKDPQSQDTVLGYPLTLTCEVHDTPASLTWYHNNTAVVTGVTTNNNVTTVAIDNTKLDTAGEYHCVVEYSASQNTLGGSHKSSVAIATVSSFIDDPQDVYVIAGTKAEMSCRTTGYIQPTFSWTSGPEISSTGTTSTASWDAVSLTDEGQYTCTAQFGDVGTLTTSPTNLFVRAIKTPPVAKMAVLGHDAALTCSAHGEGLVTITWYTDEGDQVKEDMISNSQTDYTSVLELEGVTENQNYSCKASYQSPADTTLSELALVYVHRITEVTSAVTVVSGQSTTLTCRADGTPTFTWSYTDTGDNIADNLDNSIAGSSTLILPGITTNTSVACHVTYLAADGVTLGGALTSEAVPITVNDITVHPENRTVVIGYSTSLHCSGNNQPALAWYKDNTLVTTTSPLLLSSVQLSDQTSYYCSLTWPQGSLSTSKVRVRVLDILVHPMSGIAVDGGNTSASCSAPRPATFTWYKNGAPVDPASDPRYTITSSEDPDNTHTLLKITKATPDTDGSYTCEATYQPRPEESFLGGSVVSKPATLTVYRIIGHPEDKFVLLGNEITLSCQLNDSATITWYHNDDPIGSGLTTVQGDTVTSELALSDVEWEDAGYYYCEGTYSQGTVTSTPAKVFVRGIWTAPEPATIVLNNPVTLHCVSRGEADITWSYGDVVMETTSSNYSDSNWLTIATFTIDSVSVRDPPDVTCHINYTSADPMSVNSQPVSITVHSVTTDPVDTIGIKSNNSTLSCVASGNPIIRWEKLNSGAVTMESKMTSSDDSVTSQLFFVDVQTLDGGGYKCVADYGGLGEHASQPATFTVYELTTVPEDQALEKGTQAVFVCKSNGVPTSVNWYKDDYLITSDAFVTISTEEETSTMDITDTDFGDKGTFVCEYVFEQGRIKSSPAYLSVRGFYVVPRNTVGIQDNSVTFTCIVHGESEAAMSWSMSDSPVTSGVETTYLAPNTTSLLTLTSLQHSSHNSALFVCRAVFSHPTLSISSSGGTLTVLRILTPPVETVTVSTLTATLTCKVDNGGIISWFNGTEEISGQKSDSLIFSPVSVYDQGQYYCQSTFPTDGQFTYGGTTVSEAVTLTVQRFTTVPETQYVVLGSSTSVNCAGSGSPTIIWFKGIEELQRDTTGLLTLTQVTFSDDASYSCRLNYPEGEITSPGVRVHVRGVSSSPSQGTAVLGGSVVLQCSATGDVQPLFKWTRNGAHIDGDSTVVFDSPVTHTNFTYAGVVAGDSSAKFRCEADFQGQSHESQPASVTVLSVTSAPRGVYGVVGNTASLSCTTAGNPDPDTFTWLLGGVEVTADDRITLTSPTATTTKILVTELTRADHGDYACVPSYPPNDLFLGGNTTSTTGLLSVIGITSPPVQTIVKVGDTATFTCKANSTPVPTLSWYKGGTPTTKGVSTPKTVEDEAVSYLTISNVGEGDVAPYTCKAEYPALGAHLSEEANLRFRGIEEAPLVTPAVIGLANQLNCTARGEAEADMKWLANGTEITASDIYTILTASNHDPAKEQDLIDTRTILTVSAVSLDISYLDITCLASWVSNGQSSDVASEPVSFDPLYVYKSPVNTIAVRYTKVELSCSATRTPLVRWDRSGRTYGVGILDIEGTERTHSTLVIGNVTEADQGKIWCVAEYAGGVHDSDKATLTVVGIVSEPQTRTLSQRGQSVEFTCIVDRYPLNSVSWYKGDQTIRDYENRKNMTVITKDYTVEYVLWVSSVTEEDMGAYHCKVEYPQGSQMSQPAYLRIQEPAQITLIVATGGEKEGDSIELLCQASGVPKPTITWRRSGKEFPGDDELTSSVVTVYNEPGSSLVLINMTTSHDQGIYSCVASNGVGDPVIMETELVIEAAVTVVTVASASSLLVLVVSVCTAVMLFALYKRRKRKRLHPKEEEAKVAAVTADDGKDLENHSYDNEAIPTRIQFALTKATPKIHPIIDR